MSKECIKRLEISPLFQGINHNEVGEILGYLKPRAEKYKKNEIVTFSGQSYDGIAIIARGKIAVTRDSISGNRVILDMMTADCSSCRSINSSAIAIIPVSTVIYWLPICLKYIRTIRRC
jgi:CRP-like cAMP-binding protein